MKLTRRDFVKTSALAGAGLMVAGRGTAYAYSVSPALQKFIQPLRTFGGVIPLATKDTATYTGVDYYNIVAGVFRDQLHPSLPVNGTRLYGYADASQYAGGQITAKHLGGAIIATKGRPVRLAFESRLPTTHILPFDATIPSPGNGGARQDRMAIHLHGALVPWVSDGGPFHWKANGLNLGGAEVGASVIPWLPNAAGTPTFDNFYPNNQSARLMWYHDHAVGITRLNAYAGIATAYVLTDGGPTETALGAVPSDFLVFQDKVFWDPLSDKKYATYVPGALPGDLWYPWNYEPSIWKRARGTMTPAPSAVAEMFGDTMLVNGSVYPYLNVDKGAHRFRLLNACNARFLNLSFVYEDALLLGEPALDPLTGLPVLAPVQVTMYGTEGGWLPAPQSLFASPNGTPVFPQPLFLGPAERADIVVDFSLCTGNVILYNDAAAPYPGGNPGFDYFLGAKGVAAGFGPNTRTPMLFKVQNVAGAAMPTVPTGEVPVLATMADATNGGLTLVAQPGSQVTLGDTVYDFFTTTKEITLNEAFDAFGRLQQVIGTSVLTNVKAGTFGRLYLDAPTEFIKYNTIQIWNIYNLTADTHPMHFHEFNAMVLRRRPILLPFTGTPVFAGLGRGPEPYETGWKETVKMHPAECTTVAVVVEDPMPASLYPRDGNGRPTVVVNSHPRAAVPASPRMLAAGQPSDQADEYVWHCHILEHEEHDMMRPLVAGTSSANV